MSMEREHKEYASKGIAGAGLGTGIGGLATGLPALVISAINWLNQGNRTRAVECAAGAGVTAAELMSIWAQWQNCNGNTYNGCSENTPATRYDICQAEKISALEAKNQALEIGKETDTKLLEVYRFFEQQLTKRDEAFVAYREKVASDRFADIRETDARFAEVGRYQAANTAQISCLKSQVAELQGDFNSLTELTVPASHILPQRTQRVTVTNSECDPFYTEAVK